MNESGIYMTIGYMLLSVIFMSDGMAQGSSLSGGEPQQVEERIVGTWIQVNHDQRLIHFSRPGDGIDGRRESTEINADGGMEVRYEVLDHLGRWRQFTHRTTWTYHPETHIFETADSVYFRGLRYVVRELTDSTLVLSAPGVYPADEILSFAEFQQIERFIRQYGARETINNRWNQQPFFRFPFADVYLMPYGVNPQIYGPLPYYFHGLSAQFPDGERMYVEYITRDFIDIDDEDIEALKSRLDELSSFCRPHQLDHVADGRLMNNEGFYPFHPDETDTGIYLHAISKAAYDRAGDSTRVSLSTDSVHTSVSLPLTSRYPPLPASRQDRRLVQIQLLTLHSSHIDDKQMRYGNTSFLYTFGLEIDGVERSLPMSLFADHGVVEEIKDGVLLKVRYVVPYGGTALPVSHLYYRMEYGSRR